MTAWTHLAVCLVQMVTIEVLWKRQVAWCALVVKLLQQTRQLAVVRIIFMPLLWNGSKKYCTILLSFRFCLVITPALSGTLEHSFLPLFVSGGDHFSVVSLVSHTVLTYARRCSFLGYPCPCLFQKSCTNGWMYFLCPCIKSLGGIPIYFSLFDCLGISLKLASKFWFIQNLVWRIPFRSTSPYCDTGCLLLHWKESIGLKFRRKQNIEMVTFCFIWAKQRIKFKLNMQQYCVFSVSLRGK